MPPFDEFFQPFISNLLEYIDNFPFVRGNLAFQLPQGVISAKGWVVGPFPLLLPCRVMVFPREEMLASYVHFFVERTKDLNGNTTGPGALTPLSFVKQLLLDFEHIDNDRLFIMIPPVKSLPSISGEPAASILIMPGAATQGSPFRAMGTFTALLPEDLSFKYGEALTTLFSLGKRTGKMKDESVHSHFGTLLLRRVERENPSHF